MRWLKTLIIGLLCLAVFLLGTVFAINNNEKVVIDLVLLQLPEKSLSFWLIVTFVLGAISGIMLSALTILMLKTRLGSANRRVERAQKELEQLRVSSLKDAV